VADPHVYALADAGRFLSDRGDVLIYHHSVGWDQGLALLKSLSCVKIVRYHNVTPPEFFAGIAANYEAACRSGRSQIHDIAGIGVDLYLSCSRYSMEELISLGAGNARHAVVPPFHHIDRLSSIDPDRIVIDTLSDGKVNMLTVGRVAPNKGHKSLIEALYLYERHYCSESRLLIVGKEDPRLSSYGNYLRSLVRALGLEERVHFVGGVSDSALKAYYQAAHAFVMTSHHEGFCVPLVEAMSMGIPIVAFKSTAVPETAGEAGIVWDERDPACLAATLNRVVKDTALRHALATTGRLRYEQYFTHRRIKESFRAALRDARCLP
jgi:glycosyltransferase involved in cell wall biosynthesis